MNEEKQFLSAPEAVSRLPDGDSIHTFRQADGLPVLIGADWDRADIVELLESGANIEVTGDVAQSMGHGIAVEDADGWLFIETRPAPEEP